MDEHECDWRCWVDRYGFDHHYIRPTEDGPVYITNRPNGAKEEE